MIEKQHRRYVPASSDFNYAEFPFYWLARVHGIYQLRLERALKKVGGAIPSWRILLFLKVNGPASISEISTHAIVKVPTMTRIIQRMKKAGLVKATVHATDGRVKEVALTKGGHEMIVKIQQVTERMFARSFQGLSPAQITTLNATLEKLYHNLADD